MESIESEQFKKALNLIEIFEGRTKVVFYDASQKNYISAKGRSVDLSGNILHFFTEVLGKDNVIIK